MNKSKEELLRILLATQYEVSDILCPDDIEEYSSDGGEIFNQGRGQGIFEMCRAVENILNQEDKLSKESLL